MEPARLSITHTAESSMKNVICYRKGERGHDVKMLHPVVHISVMSESTCNPTGTVYFAIEL